MLALRRISSDNDLQIHDWYIVFPNDSSIYNAEKQTSKTIWYGLKIGKSPVILNMW